MGKDRTKEITAEKAAKEIVESIGEDMAGALVEYANLVKDLATDLTDEQLEDSGYIKSLLGSGYLIGTGKTGTNYWKMCAGKNTKTHTKNRQQKKFLMICLTLPKKQPRRH